MRTNIEATSGGPPAGPGSRHRGWKRSGRCARRSARTGRALYVYGVIRARQPVQVGATGLDQRWPVHTVHHEDLAAVVSDVPLGSLEATRGNLLAHERVNAEVLREHTVIPMSFGTVFRTDDDVVELLRSGHDTFADVLDQMKDKFEFGLKVSWNRDAVIRKIEQEDEDIRSLRDEIAEQDSSGFGARMQYGAVVDKTLEQRSEQCTAEVLLRLRDVCVASRTNETVGDRMFLNAAFLVQRSREAAFDKCVQALAKDFEEFAFQFTGPWPPYNFVAIRMKRERTG